VLKIAVVIAAFNEAENIGPLCRRLLATLGAMPGTDFELIFVVEGDDGTEEVLRQLARESPEIRILRPSQALGLGAAFRMGFEAIRSDADLVATMDADLNHAPEDIPALVGALESEKADIVVGSRLVPGAATLDMPRWKQSLSRAVNYVIYRIFRTGIRDQTSGYRLYRAEVVRSLRFSNNGFAFLPEILTLAAARGCRSVERPIVFQYRRFGRSKMFLAPTAASYLRYFFGYWSHAFRGCRGRKQERSRGR
jgi:dolichol-phosphate mannosyltransferase